MGGGGWRRRVFARLRSALPKTGFELARIEPLVFDGGWRNAGWRGCDLGTFESGKLRVDETGIHLGLGEGLGLSCSRLFFPDDDGRPQLGNG